VTVVPMCVVFTTTSTGAVTMLSGYIDGIRTQLALEPGKRNAGTLFNAIVTASLIAAMLVCAITVIVSGAIRVWTRTRGLTQTQEIFEPVMK
jgi:hypothetical protein